MKITKKLMKQFEKDYSNNFIKHSRENRDGGGLIEWNHYFYWQYDRVSVRSSCITDCPQTGIDSVVSTQSERLRSTKDIETKYKGILDIVMRYEMSIGMLDKKTIVSGFFYGDKLEYIESSALKEYRLARSSLVRTLISLDRFGQVLEDFGDFCTIGGNGMFNYAYKTGVLVDMSYHNLEEDELHKVRCDLENLLKRISELGYPMKKVILKNGIEESSPVYRKDDKVYLYELAGKEKGAPKECLFLIDRLYLDPYA